MTDEELGRMQAQAARFSQVKLSRGEHKRQEKAAECKNDDGVLLLGLVMILASDGADMMLVLMLMYIFGGG